MALALGAIALVAVIFAVVSNRAKDTVSTSPVTTPTPTAVPGGIPPAPSAPGGGGRPGTTGAPGAPGTAGNSGAAAPRPGTPATTAAQPGRPVPSIPFPFAPGSRRALVPPLGRGAIVSITSLKNPVKEGDEQKLVAQVPPGAACELSVSLPETDDPSMAPGIGTATADKVGHVEWTWKVETGIPPGTATADVDCGIRVGDAVVDFEIV